MKLLVETTGDFCLHDLLGNQMVEAFRPSVVTLTPFIENHRGTRIVVLDQLADEADDTELRLAGSEEALEAAIAALPRAEKPTPKAAAKPAPAKGK